MKILVYGAGCIGSLYAGRLANSNQDVSILARGERLAQIRNHGIELVDAKSGRETTARVTAIERLDPADAFDLILVILPKQHLGEVLPTLALNRSTESILFMGNNPAGPGAIVDALGSKQVLLGFPGAGAVHDNGRIKYLILSRQEQPTTIGELDGSKTPRLRRMADVLGRAGMPVAISPNMDAWLKTHAAEVSPTANALYLAGGDHRRLARTPDGLLLMFRAIREMYACLGRLEVPITPSGHKLFRWLPEPLALAIMKRMLASESMEIKLGHALQARPEWTAIADELRALAASVQMPTPAFDRLYEYLDPATPPLPEGSSGIDLRPAA